MQTLSIISSVILSSFIQSSSDRIYGEAVSLGEYASNRLSNDI